MSLLLSRESIRRETLSTFLYRIGNIAVVLIVMSISITLVDYVSGFRSRSTDILNPLFTIPSKLKTEFLRTISYTSADLLLFGFYCFRSKSIYLLSIASLSVFLCIISCIVVFSDVCAYYGLRSGDGSVIHDDGACLYFSIITWTTVGYGDYAPTPDLRIFSAIEAMFGYICMSLFAGFFVSILATKGLKLVRDGW
jgi:hypothetical protein